LKGKRILSAALLVSAALALGGVSAAAAESTVSDDPARLEHMVVTLLMPAIRDAVRNFYAPYLTVEPTVAAYASEIVGIQGARRVRKGVYGSHFAVTVEVLPYVGPHLSVGKDRITIGVKADGTATVEEFRHLESHALPAHYGSIVKKPLP